MSNPQGVQLSDWIGAITKTMDERETVQLRQKLAEALASAEWCTSQLKRCDEKNAGEWQRMQDRYEMDSVLVANMGAPR